MKTEKIKYDKVYQGLRSKIECGLLPAGSELPGRAKLCKEFGTSERTIRRVVEMLAEDGLLKVTPKKKPTVLSASTVHTQEMRQMLRRVDSVDVNDILKSAVLLCIPVIRRGMALCTQEEWAVPEKYVKRMNPRKPTEFWRLSTRIWRFFIARVGNEMILRAVDSLGLEKVERQTLTLEEREAYWNGLKKLIQTVKSGETPEIRFDSLLPGYEVFLTEGEEGGCMELLRVSDMRTRIKGMEKKLDKTRERYSDVYLDLIGLIGEGRYQPGDRLPTHERLREDYGVSIDTTVKAIRILQEWEVVTASPKNGIFVKMDSEQLKELPITPELLAEQVRRYLDSMEFLSLTVEGVAAHAGANAAPEEVQELLARMDSQWNEPFCHQVTQYTFLEFMIQHIKYEPLRLIYEVIGRNYRMGRRIPKLVGWKKTLRMRVHYQMCIEAANSLAAGNTELFARQAAQVFHSVYRSILTNCKKLGYWECAMQVYDSSQLWM